MIVPHLNKANFVVATVVVAAICEEDRPEAEEEEGIYSVAVDEIRQ